VTHLLYRTYAKINLTLEIVGKRGDGYHDLASLVHTISLADDLRLEPAADLEARVEGLDIEPETNLVWRAAQLLATTTRERRGAHVTLVKRIPVAAGLGGGSTDAATALVGLNRLWGYRLSLDELSALAADLGSDVPFFVRGGAALMTGRGEQLAPVPPLRGQWLILAVPAHTVADKTRRLYGALRPSDFSPGDATQTAAARLDAHAPLDDADFVNGFTRAAREAFPGLTHAWQASETRCQRAFHLSGAGPALFALARDRADATRHAQLLQRDGLAAYAVRTVKHARTSISVAVG
jgi:4-diphosphocytidyl-2-C-methyl-D-erythritol kinase